MKKQGGEAITLNSNHGVVDGVRIDNIGEDGIGMINGGNWTIKDSWISRIFDDCVENDHLRSGKIVDSLVEDCFMGLSIDPGRNYGGQNQEREIVTLNGVLMSLRKADMTGRPTYNSYGIWFKTHSAWPSLKIYNSLLAFEGFPSLSGPVARLQRAWDRTVDCKDNVIAWLSDASFPANFPTPPSCLPKFVQGREARHLWGMARENWINCHPNLARLANDPKSDFSKCDPNTYGGGDTVHPSAAIAPDPAAVCLRQQAGRTRPGRGRQPRRVPERAVDRAGRSYAAGALGCRRPLRCRKCHRRSARRVLSARAMASSGPEIRSRCSSTRSATRQPHGRGRSPVRRECSWHRARHRWDRGRMGWRVARRPSDRPRPATRLSSAFPGAR